MALSYPDLIQKYLGSRTPEQLQNDLKNVQDFAAKGGNPEELLRNTRSKIFNTTTSNLQQGMQNLQQNAPPQMNPQIQSQISNLRQVEQGLGLPQAQNEADQALAAFQKVSQEAQLAPNQAAAFYKDKIPYLSRSLSDLVEEAQKNAPGGFVDFASLMPVVQQQAENQKRTLGELMGAIQNLYSTAVTSAQQASETRQKALDDIKKTSFQLYNDFAGVQREIDKEERELGIFAQKQAIESAYNIREIGAKAAADAGSGIGGLTYTTPGEGQLSDQARAVIEGALRLEDLSKATKEKIAGELLNAGYKRYKGSYIHYEKERFKLRTAESIIDSLFASVEPLVAQRQGIYGRLQGYGQKLKGEIGEDPEAKVYEDLRLAAIGPLARAISAEVGVLTNPDIERAEGVTPKLTDTEEEVRIKKGKVKALLMTRADLLDELGPPEYTVKKEQEETRIRVRMKSSGQTGTIPESEFDSNLYDRL